MNKFVDIKYENLDSEISNLLLKYYDIDKIPKFNIQVNNNALLIKELNEYIYFDKNIQYPGDDKFKIIWKNFEDNQNIEPKFEKIISRYFDLNKIEYNIDGKSIKINNNNIIEHIYFDKLIKKDKIIYYNVLYENIIKKENIIFMVQVGKWETLEKMFHNLDIIGQIKANYIIAIVENEYNEEKLDILKNKLKNLIIIEVKNKGMDIGVFLLSLLYLRNNNLYYDFLIKLHTKTDDRFREHVCEHLIGSKQVINKNIDILMNDKSIGMLNGTLIFNYHKNKSFFHNHLCYIDYLCDLLLNQSMDINKLEFAVGTFFYSRFDVFDIFTKNHIKLIYNSLNDFETLDRNWYSIFYNLKNKTDDFIRTHYDQNKSTNYGNNLELQKKTQCSGMRDFMIEHALERFFGYLNKNKKYTMVEV
tara:strand:+ start:480 stop:1730 length:1251 start_codon:yes stop_codon:yes gene_type:complete